MATVSDDRFNTVCYFLVRDAEPLNVASCSSEQKRVLYEISNTSFSSQRSIIDAYYNLIMPTLGKNTVPVFLAVSLSLIKLLPNFLFSFLL